MSSGLNALLENEDLVDVTLAVEGKFFKAHQMVLSVCSPYFKELFKTNPCQHPIVFLKDVSYVAISDLLQFMYQGEVQVSQDNLTTFIKTAEALQIKGLTGDGNGTDADSEPTQEKPERQAEEPYKPIARPKKAHPAPIVTTTPAVKKPRLSLSSNDQPAPAPITKTEPAIEPSQFKVEPFDPSQSVTIPDDGDETFGDETLDDTTVDDNEDYSMMEGEEPQAGTSTDGAGEGQGKSNCEKRISEINIKIDRLVEMLCSNNWPLTKAKFDAQMQMFPIGNVGDLEKLEKDLENKEFEMKVFGHLSKIVGTGMPWKSACYKVCGTLITKDLLTKYSWTGLSRTTQKQAFNKLTNLLDVFYRTVSIADSSFTYAQRDSFFRDAVLKHSHTRLYGPKKKTKDAKSSENYDQDKSNEVFPKMEDGLDSDESE
ncbi:unnamed protein product [Ceutorhynchus assimilis]|uniref:BTB domain-containing protein n=1 Tax=Ceutorhynchus assimilis TaxID=467358 RepID=A0A9N9MJV9_9CUCU|nr:unnamed protein product [Ceutorhynchus assimilis]